MLEDQKPTPYEMEDFILSLISKEQKCLHNNETVPDKDGFEVCPDCGTYGEDC